ncbi:MAG: hypothetical protein KA319_10205, partial [Ferruginibacter sp.]|nr:hypothetical protein [Ferruginibacter sp.]
MLIFLISCKFNYEKIENLIELKKFEKAEIQINKKLNNSTDTSTNVNYYYLKGLLFYKKYNYSQAIYWFTKSLKYKDKLSNSKMLLNAYYYTAISYKYLYKRDSSINYLYQTKKLAHSLNDKKIYASALLNLSFLLGFPSNLDAIKYYNEAKLIADSLKDNVVNGNIHFLKATEYSA